MRESDNASEGSVANLLEEALRYREQLGWALIPIGADKRPHFELLPKDGHGNAVWRPLAEHPASVDEIRHWFEQDPECNIGLITGDASGGIAVADFDRDTPPGMGFPPTVMAQASRGPHVYFRVPRGTTCRDHEWGELRANGGYVVLPHSRHPNGGLYRWHDYLSPFDVDLADLPAFLLPPSGVQRPSARRGSEDDADTPSPTLSQGLKQVNNIVYLLEHSVAVGDEGYVPNTCQGEQLSRWAGKDAVAAKAATLFGVGPEAISGRAFRCILPGHTDRHASASIHFDPKRQVYLYRDWHALDGEQWYTLGEVRAAFAYGQPRRLSKPEMAVWLIRLLVELEFVRPVRVPWAGVLPPETPERIRQVYNGFLLLLGCKWLHTLGDPTPFTWRFAAAWCGIPQTAAGMAIGELMRHKYMVPRGKYKNTTLFDAHVGDGKPF